MICKWVKSLFKKNKKDPVKEEPKEDVVKPRVTGYQVAQRFVGKNEKENSQWIIDEWKRFGRPDYNEKTEWCSLFILHCEDIAGNINPKEVPDNFEVARSWWNTQMTGYKKVKLEDVKYGDIIISQRGESWQGHVGYFGGYRGATQYYCLGGNKSDQVKMGYLNKDKIVGIIRYEA